MSILSDIQKQIIKAIEEHERLLLAAKHLEDLREKYKKGLEYIAELDKILDQELKDIEALEALGVKSLFHKMLGSKEEQLEKERQDFLEASLKYKAIKKTLELQKYEINILDEKVHRIPILRQEIESLKSQREQEILANNNTEEARLLSIINEKYDLCVILNKNIKEAIEEGEKAQKLLKLVLSYLKKARDWGNWDMAGSKLGNLSKNRAIDMAMSHLTKAQHQLDLFAGELQDIGKATLGFQITKLQFNKFTDFFFDNLISDWIIQQKIKSTISNVESTMDQIKRLQLSLEQESKAYNKQKKELEQKKNDLLIS